MPLNVVTQDDYFPMPAAKRTKYAIDASSSSRSKSSTAGSKKSYGRYSFAKKKGAKLSAGMRAEIKKIVESSREIKVDSRALSDTLVNYSGAAGVTQALAITDIDEGAGLNERIGQEIQLKKVTWKFCLNAPDTMNEIMNVWMVVIKDRLADSSAISANVSDIKLAALGGNQGVSSATGIADQMLPWNTDRYTIAYEEIFQMRPGTIGGATSNIGNYGDKQQYFRSVDLTRFFPKKINFASSTGGAGPTYTVMAIPLETAGLTAGLFPVLTSNVSFLYTDA